MKELNIFIDESGDFGEYEPHSPFYIVTLVFHDQAVDISENFDKLRNAIKSFNIPRDIIHSGPLLRREREFANFPIAERKKIFDSLFHFIRVADITYHSLIVEKKNLSEDRDLPVQIKKQLSAFIRNNLSEFASYGSVNIYYDYGQSELTSILFNVFNAFIKDVTFKKAIPAKHKLFQAADMLCTMELLALKADRKALSKSELTFFGSTRNFNKSYLKTIRKKMFSGF